MTTYTLSYEFQDPKTLIWVPVKIITRVLARILIEQRSFIENDYNIKHLTISKHS